METEEKVVAVSDIFDGKVIKVKKYTVVLPDGRESVREEVLHNGGACALVVDDGEVVFVSQYRLAAKRDLLEIPAGKLNDGEDPVCCAARELREEAGIVAKEMKLISAFYPSPGYTNEIIYVYHCTSFDRTESTPDDGELLNVVRIPVEKAIFMALNGEISDGKTVVALLYLKNLLSVGKKA